MDQQTEAGNFTHWQIRTPKTARKDRPPTEYIIDKFFSRGSLNVVYGAPGSLKSMLMADACACVVAGQDWLPGATGKGRGIKVKQAPVLWYDYDNGLRRTDERFNALIDAPGRTIPDDAPLYYVSMPEYAYFATDVERCLYMIDLAQQLAVEMIVIDNLGLITGDVEENSSAMAQVMGALRILAERTQAAVIVIHHQRKGGAQNSRAGDALRGHSSIEAALDLALHVVREPDSQDVVVRSTKTRGVDVPQVTAQFYFEHRAGTRDLEQAWFTGIAPIVGINPVRSTIMDVVRDFGKITKGRLVDEVCDRMGQDAPGINRVRNWVNELVAIGDLRSEKDGTAHVITSI